jgi:hypothetical protein
VEKLGTLAAVSHARGRASHEGHVVVMVERALAHGCHALGACRPLKHFVEHVAHVEVAEVGGDFGLDPG